MKHAAGLTGKVEIWHRTLFAWLAMRLELDLGRKVI